MKHIDLQKKQCYDNGQIGKQPVILDSQKKGEEQKMRFIALKDSKRLEEAGVPWSTSYLYKLRHYNTYPNLIVKVAGRLMLNRDEFEKMAEEDIKKQTAKRKRMDSMT